MFTSLRLPHKQMISKLKISNFHLLQELMCYHLLPYNLFSWKSLLRKWLFAILLPSIMWVLFHHCSWFGSDFYWGSSPLWKLSVFLVGISYFQWIKSYVFLKAVAKLTLNPVGQEPKELRMPSLMQRRTSGAGFWVCVAHPVAPVQSADFWFFSRACGSFLPSVVVLGVSYTAAHSFSVWSRFCLNCQREVEEWDCLKCMLCGPKATAVFAI